MEKNMRKLEKIKGIHNPPINIENNGEEIDY